jgi:hypothetical protein
MAMSVFQIFSYFASFCSQESPTPIPFVFKVRMMEKIDGPDMDELEFLMNPYLLSSKIDSQRSGSSGWWPSVRLIT